MSVCVNAIDGCVCVRANVYVMCILVNPTNIYSTILVDICGVLTCPQTRCFTLMCKRTHNFYLCLQKNHKKRRIQIAFTIV